MPEFVNGTLIPLFTSIVEFVKAYPWLLAIVGVMVIMVIVARRRAPIQKDPKRLFTSQERQEAARRAGGRCEHKSPLWFRCSRDGAHGDHIYPWSKGGSTTMSNHQWLCVMHNLRKSNHVPSKLYIWRLEQRRKRYFPRDIDPRVEYRIAR